MIVDLPFLLSRTFELPLGDLGWISPTKTAFAAEFGPKIAVFT
jgi:hypothetical protein